MSIKKGKKLGFFASLAMLVGSVVGIGIFLKNHSILDANSWSGSGALVSWLIGGLLSLAAAISFSEISSFKHGKTAGLTDWAEKVGGKKFGYFIRFNYPIFYFTILNTAIAFFASETVIAIITAGMGVAMPHLSVIFVVAIVIFIFFTVLNYISIKGAGRFAQVTVILKFIPLILVALLGIVFATTNNHPITPKPGGKIQLFGQNAFTNGQPFNMTRMLAALPAVLFAYDAFLLVASLRKDMEKPEKLPAVVFVGMLSVVTLYVLISISAILHGSGMVSGRVFAAPPEAGLGIFDQIFSPSVAKGMGMFVIVFIAISTLGVVNGITAATVATYSQLLETDTIFGSKKLKTKFGKKAPLVLMSIVFSASFLMMGIPAMVLNSDAIIDAFSNFPTLFFFAVYALVILLYTIKREEHSTKKIKGYIFKPAAWIAIIGIGFVIAYQIGYGMTLDLFNHASDDASSGLFADHGNKLTNLGLSMVFIASAIIFAVGPVINQKLIKKFEKRSVIVSTQLTE